jgi:hypothetical protein
MKINKTFLGLLVILGVALVFYSFKAKTVNKKYQYLAVYAEHYDLDKVHVSIDGKEYKNLHLTKQIQGPWDINPLINLIHQYENEGWELMSLYNYEETSFNMRKEIE